MGGPRDSANARIPRAYRVTGEPGRLETVSCSFLSYPHTPPTLPPAPLSTPYPAPPQHRYLHRGPAREHHHGAGAGGRGPRLARDTHRQLLLHRGHVHRHRGAPLPALPHARVDEPRVPTQAGATVPVNQRVPPGVQLKGGHRGRRRRCVLVPCAGLSTLALDPASIAGSERARAYRDGTMTMIRTSRSRLMRRHRASII